MATGDKSYKGLAVPLNGESEITQLTAATDILTITGASAQSGSFLVCQNSSGTDQFKVGSNGALTVTAGGVTVTAGDLAMTAGDVAITKGYFLRFSDFYTTAVPTTGLTKGDLFLAMKSSTAQLAVCTDTTSQTLAYFTTNTATFGRASTT